MRPVSLRFALLLAGLSAWLACAAPARALKIQFDYTYDDGGFFSDPAARAALEHAAGSFEICRDEMTAIEPGGVNWWKAVFHDPRDTTQSVLEPNLVVPADTVTIFVGADELGTQTLGLASRGGMTGGGYAEWGETLKYRGQEGAAEANPTDYGPWGGSITFNASKSWSFGIYEAPSDPQDSDFLSVALHELCHVLGFGPPSPNPKSWDTYVDAGTRRFLGPEAVAEYGGPVPLDDIDTHWAPGTLSTNGGAVQEAAMDPNLVTGTRKLLTELDLAAMRDIGWEMPQPGDADRDGDVDFLDYLTVKAHLGGLGGWTDGDFDFDQDIDAADLSAVEAFFSLPVPPAAAPVPEPASAMLLLAGAAALLRRARRGR